MSKTSCSLNIRKHNDAKLLKIGLITLVAVFFLSPPPASANPQNSDFTSLQLTIESSCHRILLADHPTPGNSMVDGKVRYKLSTQVQRTSIVRLRGDQSLAKHTSNFQPSHYENQEVPGRGKSAGHFFIDVERDEQGQIFFTYVVEADAQQVESMRPGTHKYEVMITEGTWDGYLKGQETKFQFTPTSLIAFRQEYTYGIRRAAETMRTILSQTFANNNLQILPLDSVATIHKHPEVFRAIDGKLGSGNPTRTFQFTFTVMAQLDDLTERFSRRLDFIEESLNRLRANDDASNEEIQQTLATIDDLQLAISLMETIRAKVLEMDNFSAQAVFTFDQNNAATFIETAAAIAEISELKKSLREVIERLPANETDLRRAVTRNLDLN